MTDERHVDGIEIDFERFEESIGRKVRLLREERGWSQTELARRLSDLGLDMHQTTVAKMESGRRPLRVSEAVAITQALKIPANTLFWLPVPGETRSLAEAREELAEREQRAEETKRFLLDSVETFALTYATQLDLVRTMAGLINDVARVESTAPDQQRAVARQVLREITDRSTKSGRNGSGDA